MATKTIFGNSTFQSQRPKNVGLFDTQPVQAPAPTATPGAFQRSSVFGPADVTQGGWPLLEATVNDAEQFNRDSAMRRGALERYRRATDPSLAGSRYAQTASQLFSMGNRTGMGNAARLGNMGYGRAAQDAALLGSQNAATEAANNAYLAEFDPVKRAQAAQMNLASYGADASLQSMSALQQMLNMINQTQQTANSKPKESGGLFGDLLNIAGSVVPLIPLPGAKKSNAGMA